MRRQLTNTVVYAIESDHNLQQASLMTRAGYGPENRSSLVAYVRPRTRTNVLLRVLPPAAMKTCSFWVAGGSTRGSTLVRVRVRTYTSRELRFSGLYPTRVIKDACYGLCSLSLASPFPKIISCSTKHKYN